MPTSATAVAASQLASSHTLTATGDANWGVTFDGSADVTAPLTLANSGVAAGNYGSATTSAQVSVDAKGRVTAAQSTPITPDWSNVKNTPTTLTGYGITDTATARSMLGLGTMATQNANSVAITGGVIDNVPIGMTTPARAKFSFDDGHYA